MKVYEELNLKDFNAWSGAVVTKERIINEGKEQEFEELIEELYPNGIDVTELNDLLWLDQEYVLGTLGIETELEE